MRSLLIISYTLRLRKLYNEIIEKIDRMKIQSLLKNRTKYVKLVSQYVGKAYKEGVKFKNFKYKTNKSSKIEHKTAVKVINDFIRRVKQAEDLYKFKMQQLKEKRKSNGIKRNLTKGQQEIIEREYITGIKKAVNAAIFLAADEGRK